MRADLVLDRLEDLLGALDPGARRGADVQLDQPGIDRAGRSRSRRTSDSTPAPATTQQATAGTRTRRAQHAVEQPAVEVAEAVEAAR